jgi:hypothetical protein
MFMRTGSRRPLTSELPPEKVTFRLTKQGCSDGLGGAVEEDVHRRGRFPNGLSLFGLCQAQAEGGIEMGLAGTSVATETCDQVRVLKLRKTGCECWICVALTAIERGAVMGIGGFTRNSGTGYPAAPVCAGMISGGWPGSKIGTSMVHRL